jgi:hypothetical protein
VATHQLIRRDSALTLGASRGGACTADYRTRHPQGPCGALDSRRGHGAAINYVNAGAGQSASLRLVANRASGLGDHLNRQRHRLTTTNAQRRDSALTAPLMQAVNQRGQNTSAGCADGVS